MPDLTHFQIIAAALIGILSVARTARLLVHDAWPPVAHFRVWWDNHVTRGGWGVLVHCQFCVTPYMAAVMFAWFYYGGEHWTWWVINGVWGGSYLAAMVVSYDQPPE